MSDFRKLLLAFAAVTLFAGIASAGPAPALNHTAQPFSVRDDATSAIAPDIISIEANLEKWFQVCGVGLQAPAFLVDTQGTFTTNNAQSLILGAPALPPAPNIAALESGTAVASGNAPIIANTGQTTLSAPSAQATGHLAATPANLKSNSSNARSTHSNWTTLKNSTLNGTANTNNQFVAVDTGQVTDPATASNAFNAANAAAQPGLAVVAPSLAVPAVARTAPTHAGSAG
jgi:hypothetical protein